MGDHPVFACLLAGWCGLGAIACLALFQTAAPYGRFERPGWGPGLPPRLAWFLMESPGAFVFAAVLLASRPIPLVPALFGAIWLVHYGYRGFLYPVLIRSTRRVPVMIVASAIGFHAANATLQAWALYRLRPARPVEWLLDLRFVAGAALFAGGVALAAGADGRLRRLRPHGGQQYCIPTGGLFKYISCPNYLGEIVEWTGWAVLTWTSAGAAFAFWTVANLLPRAVAVHRWYRRQFTDYPPERRALIPHIL
jgi:hypothetical protein